MTLPHQLMQPGLLFQSGGLYRQQRRNRSMVEKNPMDSAQTVEILRVLTMKSQRDWCIIAPAFFRAFPGYQRRLGTPFLPLHRTSDQLTS
jgi:hypothetical protein